MTFPACHAQLEHAALQPSSTLDFRAILDSALAQAPEMREATVREQQAEAYVGAGDSWIAGRPAFAFNYYDDSTIDNHGQVESNYGLQVPLWRPGERRDSQQLGRHYREQLDLWRSALELEIAGRVRNSLADLDETKSLLQVEREATSDAEELLRVTIAQFEAGAVARLDVMQAENLLLEQRKRELAASAALVDAEVTYTLLTGLRERPAGNHAEPLSSQSEIPEQHPLLGYLQSDVSIAEGNIRQDEIAAKGNPQLLLGTRRERGDRFTPYTESLNISLTIPFGGRSFVSARSSAARRDKVDAEVRYFNTRRSLQLALHDAEHELAMTEQALSLAERQREIGTQRRDLAQVAFAQGELTLVQVLLAVQEARIASRELALLQLRRERLIAQFNQLIGVLP